MIICLDVNTDEYETSKGKFYSCLVLWSNFKLFYAIAHPRTTQGRGILREMVLLT